MLLKTIINKIESKYPLNLAYDIFRHKTVFLQHRPEYLAELPDQNHRRNSQNKINNHIGLVVFLQRRQELSKPPQTKRQRCRNYYPTVEHKIQ